MFTPLGIGNIGVLSLVTFRNDFEVANGIGLHIFLMLQPFWYIIIDLLVVDSIFEQSKNFAVCLPNNLNNLK